MEEKEIYWFHPDHLGSSSFITGLDGEVTQNMEYFPSGEIFVENHYKDDLNSQYKFNGKEMDSETGYYYYGARYYNPRVSLWLSVDPLAESLPNWSPYIYTFNNPIKYVDPTGQDEWVRNTDGTYARVGSRGDDEMDYLLDKPGGNVIETKELVRGYSEFRVLRSYGVGVGTSGGALYDPSFDIAKEIILSEIVLAWKPVKWLTRAISRPIGKGLSWIGQKVSRGSAWVARSIVKIFKPCGCFTSGTQVLTEQGYKNIEDIKEGDIVWSYDDKTGDLKAKKVTGTSALEFSQILKIYIENEVIEATHEHPFFIGGKWMKADQLKVGDYVTLYDGTKKRIDKIEFIDKGHFKVYNFEVEDYHSYFVGQSKVLVHNGNPCKFGVAVSALERLEARLVGLKDRFTGNISVKAFGSRTKGTHRPDSDLDIVVIAEDVDNFKTVRSQNILNLSRKILKLKLELMQISILLNMMNCHT